MGLSDKAEKPSAELFLPQCHPIPSAYPEIACISWVQVTQIVVENSRQPSVQGKTSCLEAYTSIVEDKRTYIDILEFSRSVLSFSTLPNRFTIFRQVLIFDVCFCLRRSYPRFPRFSLQTPGVCDLVVSSGTTALEDSSVMPIMLATGILCLVFPLLMGQLRSFSRLSCSMEPSPFRWLRST